MTAITRPFGSTIRAYRLGFHWSERHGAFIRISTDGPRNVVELAPVDGIPVKTTTKAHRCWWEGDGPRMLDMMAWLRGVRRVKRYICVEVDDNGDIVGRYKK
jgi:hypothetical protein